MSIISRYRVIVNHQNRLKRLDYTPTRLEAAGFIIGATFALFFFNLLLPLLLALPIFGLVKMSQPVKPTGLYSPAPAPIEGGVTAQNGRDMSLKTRDLYYGFTPQTFEKPSPILLSAQYRRDLHLTAKALLPDFNRLQKCFAATKDPQKPTWGQYAANVDKARLTNYCFCQYPFICPNCGPWKAEEKRIEAQNYLLAWFAEGYTAFSYVLTFQHFASETLQVVDNRFQNAVREMYKSRDWEAFAAKWQIIGRLQGPDYTYGENGHHLHRNQIGFLERDHLSADRERPEFEASLKAMWQKFVGKAGGYADLELGCVVGYDRLFDFVDYMSSKAAGCDYNGTDTRQPKANGRQWGLAEEMTKHEFKTSRKGKTYNDLLNAYAIYAAEAALLRADGLLEAAAIAQQEADKSAQAVREYAEVFKGKHLLDPQPKGENSLKKRLEALCQKHADLMLPERTRPEYDNVFAPSPAAKAQLNRLSLQHEARAALKELKGNPEGMRQFLQEHGIFEVFYPALDAEYPDWWIAPPGTPPEKIAATRQFYRDMAEYNGFGVEPLYDAYKRPDES